MLFDQVKEASMRFMEGLIDEQEYVTALIIALGDYKAQDASVVDLADALEKYQGGDNAPQPEME
jgi:hypothetical protein